MTENILSARGQAIISDFPVIKSKIMRDRGKVSTESLQQIVDMLWNGKISFGLNNASSGQTMKFKS